MLPAPHTRPANATQGPFDYAMAHTCLLNGVKIARGGWNAPNQAVFLAPALSFRVTEPAGAGKGEPLAPMRLVNIDLPRFPVLRNARGGHAPWFPSHGDLMALDWYLVE